ncbi:MAG: FAD binding domain-containing protein [Actinomycetota bacterium]|nr:FAD binding domain-containing protein [Actinomycetota bacterium]
MKPAPFRYERPTTLEEAVSLLAGDEEAKLIAGGQSLLPLLSLRLARPSVLVDLDGIDELTAINLDPAGSVVRFGAMVRHHISASQTHHPLVADAAGWIGHTAIRSRGTIGGSLAHADPAAELPAVALALDATMHVLGPRGARSVPASNFFVGTFQTALAADELLVDVDFPIPRRWGFAEVARKHGDFALVLVVAAELQDGWRLVAGGLGGTPIRLTAAEAALDAGVDPAEAGAAAQSAVDPVAHLHASSAYLAAMAGTLVTKALANVSVDTRNRDR